MGVTYILIFVLLLHMYIFRKLIFNWNVYGVFFISNLIFSLIGIILFPFIKEYVVVTFWTFKLNLITDYVIIKTQIIALSAVLISLYSYAFIMFVKFNKIKCINHLEIKNPIENNISNINYYFLLLIIGIFLFFYLIINRDIIYDGFFKGLIGRDPAILLSSRRRITSNYIYVIITYNLLPFLTIVALYMSMSYKSLLNKFLFYSILTISVILILLLFQKRPLILFLLTLIISSIVFRKHVKKKKLKVKKPKTKKQIRKKIITYGIALFALLMILYYSSTNYKFENIVQATIKLTEVSLTRVLGRLSMPSFLYISYFPDIDGHYGLRNIGMLSKILGFEIYGDTKILFKYFGKHNLDGNVAIGSIIDFYGGFGYYGVLFGSMLIGSFLGILDILLNKLKKNSSNIIFIIFCFIFGYYLSQASFARSLMGYGFFFFTITWLFLQKEFKIKLRQ